MGKRDRNRFDHFAALFRALGNVLANTWPCPPARHHSTAVQAAWPYWFNSQRSYVIYLWVEGIFVIYFLLQYIHGGSVRESFLKTRVCVCVPKVACRAGPTDVQVIKSSRQSVQTQSREGPNPTPTPTPDVAGATRQKTVAKKPAKIQRAVQYRPATVPSPLNINGEFYVIDNFLIV